VAQEAGTCAPVCVCENAAADVLQRGSRKLFDIEKLEFRTDAAAGVAVAELTADTREAPVVVVSAHASGALPRGLGAGGGVLVFDITLSPLVSGLPAEVLQLRAWVAACIALALIAALCCAPVGGSLGKHPAHRYLATLHRRAGPNPELLHRNE
jgi:hypothetical protein